jgi:hypothetical protein
MRRQDVRRRWEQRRWRDAAPAAALALPFVAPAWWAGSTLGVAAVPALAAALVVAHHRGGDAARGARAGLLAGAIAATMLAVSCAQGVCGSGDCVTTCLAAGLAGAASLVPGAWGRDLQWGWWAVGAAALGAGAACVPMGLAGLAVVPALAAVVPVQFVARWRRPAAG